MAGWMIVERLENWEVDASNNFSFFGLSERYRKSAGEVQAGDLLFCYVSSGLSAFADIRRVKEAGLQKLKVQPYYSAFPYSFTTLPYMTLPRERWLPLKTILQELDLTRGRKEFRALFQTSIRKLTDQDSKFLEKQISARLK